MSEREKSTPTSRRLKKQEATQEAEDLKTMEDHGKLSFGWLRKGSEPGAAKTKRKRGRKRS